MNPTSKTFERGDRVRTSSGVACTVRHIDPSGLICVAKDTGYVGYVRAFELTPRPPMSQPARALLAAWHASDRTLQRIDRPNSSNRANINWGRAIRRYLSPDGSIDMTIAVEAN